MNDSALARDVERALVARGAMRRGRHLRMQCPAPGHTDVRPSCDVDLERGWVCRSCGRGGGLYELAELLGIATPPARPAARPARRVPPPPPGITREEWAPAWTAICETARRQEHRLAPFRDVYRVSDWLRSRHQLVADAWRVVAVLGPDDPAAWRLAGLAARVQTDARVIEAALDQALRDAA